MALPYNEYGRQHQRQLNNNYFHQLAAALGEDAGTYQRGIAIAQWHLIDEVVTNADTSRILLSQPGIRQANSHVRFPELEARAQEAYEGAGAGLFRALSDKNVSSSEYFGGKEASDLRYQYMDSVMVKQGANDLLSGWQNVQDKGKLVYFDTETFSGINEYGQHQTDALTEFNFRVISRNEDGTWDLSRNAEDNEGKIFKSIIGTTEEQHQRNLKLIDKFKAGGSRSLSNLEMVTLERLALTGHENTEYVIRKDGVANFTSFAGKDDIADRDPEVMRRGARRMRDIGIMQEKAPLVEFAGHKMRGWEREMMQGLIPIFADDVTAMGYNTEGFDWPTLQTFVKHGNVTQGFRAALKELTGGGTLLPKNRFDVMAGLSNADLDRNRLYTESERKLLQENGLTALQQEALAYRGGQKAYNAIYSGLKAHMADTDTFVGAHLALNTDLVDLMDLDGQARAVGVTSTTKLKGNRHQLFMSTTGRHVGQYGLWGFRHDALTGEYRTTDGFAISTDKDGNAIARKEIMDQYLFRKEANYSILNVSRLSDDEKLGNLLGKINPDMNKDGLYAVTFLPEVSGEKTLLSQSPSTIVGTKDKIEQYIGQTMYHVADMGRDGNWHLAADRKMRNDLSLILKDGDSLHIGGAVGAASEETDENFLQYILDNGTKRFKYEAASRDARAFDYKKDTGVLAFLDDMHAAVGDLKGEDAERAKKNFLLQTRDKSKKLEERLRNLGEKEVISDAELQGTYHSYFGYKDFNNGWNPNVFTETVEKQLARAEYVEANRYMHETAIRHARIRAGLPEMPEGFTPGTNSWLSDVSSKNRSLVSAYYRQYMQGFEDAAVALHGEEAARNLKKMPAFAYTKNTFEVNLRGYRPDIVDDKFVRFRLNGSGLGFADQLFRAIGVDPNVRRYGDHERVAELKRFQEWLFDNGKLQKTQELYGAKHGYKLKRHQKIRDTDYNEQAAQRLIGTFRTEKNLNPYGDIEKDITRFVLQQAEANKAMSIEEIDLHAKKLDESIPGITIKEGDDLKLHAQEITDKVLFGGQTPEEIQKQLEKAGYDKKQIDFLMRARDQRFKDTMRFMEDYLSAAISNGVDIGYDTKHGTAWFAHRGEPMKLENVLPKDIFENGMFFTQIGNTKTASPLGFYDVNGKLEFGSLIKKAAPSRYMMNRIIRRGVENGNVLDQLKYIAGRLDKDLRESSSVDGLDAQDRKSAFYFNWKDVVEHLDELQLSDDDFTNADPEIKDILNDIIHPEENSKGQKVTAKNVTTAQRIAINAQSSTILKAAMQQAGAPGYIQDIIPLLRYNTKKAGEFIAAVDDMLDFGEDTGSTKRGIHNQSSRAIHFNRTEAEKQLSGLDIKYGQAISSKARAFANTHIDGNVGYDVDVTARMYRMAMSTKDVRKLVNSIDDIDDYSLNMLSSIHTDEGAGAIDGRIADRIFNYRNSMQTVPLKNIYERNATIADVAAAISDPERGLKEVSPHLYERSMAAFKIDSVDGKIKFDYGQGTFVRAGQEFLSKLGYDGAAQGVRAKESGVLRLGVFSKDGRHLANVKTINELFESIKVGRNATAEDLEKAKQQAFDLLKTNYSLSYYIRGLDAATNSKIAEMGTEKGMLRSMIATTGAINQQIYKTLERAGLSSLNDIALDIEYIDSLNSGKPLKDTLFGVMAGATSNQSIEDIERTIIDSFGSLHGFHDALLAERYMPWDYISGAAKKAGIKEEVHVISNTFSAEKKHKDAKAFVNRIANAMLDVYDKNTVYDKLKTAIPGLEFDGNQFTVSGSYQIKIGALNNLIEKEIASGKIQDSKRTLTITDKEGKTDKIAADVVRVDLELEPNFDRGRSYAEGGALQKAIKLNHRAVTILSGQRMDDTRKGRVRKALSDALDGSGSKLGSELFDQYVAGYENGDIVSQGAIDTIRENIYTRPGESANEIAHYDKQEGRMVIGNHLARELEKDGISRDIAQTIADVAHKSGTDVISRRVIEERYAAQSFAQAFRFNKDGDLVGAQDLIEEHGMNTLNVLDMTLPKNGANAVEFMDSAYGKEFMLDLHMSNSNRQLYSKGTGIGRYVYVPYAPPKYMPNGELALSPYHKTLGRIHNLIQDYNERMDGTSSLGPMNDKQKDDFFTSLGQQVEQLKEDIRVGLTSKNGYIANLSRAHIEDSGIFTAYGNELFFGGKSKLFQNLEFKGIKLSQHALESIDPDKPGSLGKKALDIDYTILSKKTMHQFYDQKVDNILGALGMEGKSAELKSDLYRHLETKGTLALNIREPQGYAKSTSVSATYFSDIVRGDEAIVSAVQHNSKKGDYDSDKVEAALLKGNAKITANGQTQYFDLDWAMYDQLKATEGIDVEWADDKVARKMNNHISAMLVNAESNKLWRMKENKLLDYANSFSGQHMATYTVEGRADGTLVSRRHIADENELARLHSFYDDLNAEAQKYYKGNYADGKFDEFMTSATAEDKLEKNKAQNIDIDGDAYRRRKLFDMLDDEKQAQRLASSRNMSIAEFRQNAMDSVSQHLTEHLNDMEATLNSLKPGAGEINYHLYKYMNIAMESGGVSEEDFSKIIQVHTALNEAFLSPKNEEKFDPRSIDNLSNAMGNAYKAMQGRYDRATAAQELKDAILPTLMARESKEMSQLPGILNRAEELKNADEAKRKAIAKSLIEDAAESYATKVIMTTDLRGADPRMYDIGVTKGLTNPNSDLVMSAEGSEHLNQQIMRDINEQAKEMGLDEPIRRSRGARARTIERAETPASSLLEDRQELTLDGDTMRSVTATDAAKSIAKLISDVHMPKGGLGVAIAGGLMLSGYVSSPATPAPATSQADGAQQEFQDMYSTAEVPSFSDTGMNSLRGGPKQGYVINISAQTADGRQQAVDAINSAIGGAVPSASSINIAMNTSYIDKISQFQIDKMVANAF